MPESTPGRAYPVLLYDGVCGLCNRVVQFVLKRDPSARIRFASLQSDYAARILQPHGLDSRDLNTIYFIDQSGKVLARSSAVISILRELGGRWRALAVALSIFPKPLRDWGYGVVARHRYRVFGRHETCVLPEQKYQSRFLDL
ncbi:MAG: thiol-disulfide oxidoreductase DCC family protein [Terriglobales bacterium]